MRALTSHPNPALAGLRMPDGVPAAGLYYRFMRRGCQVIMSAFWKVRVFNRHHEPAEGSAVYICNHQSFLDPMLMSMALRRPMNYMARHTLFRTPGFSQLIRSVNAFPVRRGTADTAAMKEAMRRLRKGQQLAVFAEGTRTRTGRIGPFLPGVALLAQRVADWTVPVLIDGAFEAWPRTQVLPSPGNIVVLYAEPISRQDARRLEPLELIDRVRNTIIEMQADVRRRAGRRPFDYD
jgi:1-acyl-sn-glycerol-3-phosphate acyltransferase